MMKSHTGMKYLALTLLMILSLSLGGCFARGKDGPESSDAAPAEGAPIEAGGSTISPGNCLLSEYDGNIQIKDSGTYTLSGSLSGSLIIDAPDNQIVLVLDNVSIMNAMGPCLEAKDAADLVIELEGSSSFSSGQASNASSDLCAVSFNCPVHVQNNGSLSISSQSSGIESTQKMSVSQSVINISSRQTCLQTDTLSLEKAILNFTSDQGAGLYVQSRLDFDQAVLNVSSTLNSLSCKGDLECFDSQIILTSTNDAGALLTAASFKDSSLAVQSRLNALQSDKTLLLENCITTLNSTDQAGIDCDLFTLYGGQFIAFAQSESVPQVTDQPILYLQLAPSSNALTVRAFEEKADDPSYELVLQPSAASTRHVLLSSDKMHNGENLQLCQESACSVLSIGSGITRLSVEGEKALSVRALNNDQ